MSNNEMERSIDEHMNPAPKQPRNWIKFLENEVAAFFNANEIEKMTIEDGEGNKAKLTRLKDNSIKLDQTSSTIL